MKKCKGAETHCGRCCERCGVPPRMLKIVKSFHVGMEAEVRVGALLSDSFEVRMVFDRDVL